MIKLPVDKTKQANIKILQELGFTSELCPLQVFPDGREVSISSRSTATDS